MNDLRTAENFSKALDKLKEFVALPVITERDRAGVIQAFEFTFEQCWKAFQRVLAAQGYEARTPRKSLEGAIQLRLIRQDDEKDWLKMMKDRNLTSHLYHEKLAIEIADRITKDYLTLLTNAHKALLLL
jgi:nucleotidyltransferase substrate binding protein (TIGR01987 family)